MRTMRRAIRPMDIWMVSLTESVGNEQRGQRPAVVLAVYPQANVCMVVPLTSNLDAARFPYAYPIGCSSGNGLSADSVVLVFQMRTLTISAGRFLSKVGTLEQTHFHNLKLLIGEYLEIV